jgi:hypothetical protein
LPKALRFICVILLVVCAFVALTKVSRHAGQTWAVSDGAVIELYTIYASHGLQTLGAYSQRGWHHPGPALFYWLVPFYVAGGSNAAALSAGAAALNLVSLVTFAWVVSRKSWMKPATAIAILVLLCLYVGRAHELLTNAWNPDILVFPFLAVLALSAAVADGDLWLLPILAIFASFVAQAHVGLIPTVAGTVLTSLVLAVTSPSRSSLREWVFWLQAMVWSLLAIWALPLVEQLTGTPGNFTSMVREFVGPNAVGKPPDRFIHTWADMLFGVFRPNFSVPRGWLLKPSLSEWSSVVAVALITALGVAAAREMQQRRRFHSSFAIIALVASALACWSVSRIHAGVADHEVFWISALGVIDLGIVLGTWVDLPLTPIVSRRLTGGVAFAFALASLALAFRELRAVERQAHQVTGEPEIVKSLTRQLTAALQKEGIKKPRFDFDRAAWGIGAGVLLQLRKDGQPFTVDQSLLTIFESPLAPTGNEDGELSIGGDLSHWSAIVRHDDAVTLAQHDGVFIDAFNLTRK